MVAKDRQSKTDSPKVEVGEIDTRAPFQSVKDAVNLFGEGAFSGEKIATKKIKPQSAERVLVKETKLHLAQKELYKLKEKLKSAETTKTGALAELEQAKRTVEDLKKKLETVNKAKEAAIKAAEAATSQAKQFETGETNANGGLKQDLENTKQQYATVFTELDAAKQELNRIRLDREAAIEEQNAAIKQETESELIKKVTLDRAGEISKEILTVQKTIEQVKLAVMEAHQQQENVYTEKNVEKLAHKAALEESAKKLLALRERFDPQAFKDLETQYEQTTSEIKRLQTGMENVKASDLDSLKKVTLELDEAKESLQKTVDEQNLLKKLLEDLKIELENVKKEHEELKQKEVETEAVVGNLNLELNKSKTELENARVEEAKATSASDEMMQTVQQLVSESENAKLETEEMRAKAEELKKEAGALGVSLEEAESKLKVVLMEAEEAKKAESKALEDIKIISERTDAARASTSESGSKITVSQGEFEAMSRKVEESEKLAEMKVEAAMAQVEAVRASEKEAMKKLEATQKEIDELKAATEAALKRAESAEAAKRAVEGELKRWREKEQKKPAEAAALILQETQMQQQTPSLPSTPNYKQSPPQKPKTKKVLVSNFSGIFQRKKSHIDGGSSPSYLPGEKAV
ncbi:WEB family protein At5g55860-like [Bidens hawaiensis]|uniref:WEB family protein At5g55860-like n=1 Tax=Bidens hawaiensis TaxID=980011 RepID=UPI00404928D3